MKLWTVILWCTTLSYVSGQRELEQVTKLEKFLPTVEDKLLRYAVPNLIKNSLFSYAGLLDGLKSRMFFWMIPTTSSTDLAVRNEQANVFSPKGPLIIWLGGDLTASSIKGLFENNGPYYVKPNKGLGIRKVHWAINATVLYLDTFKSGFSQVDTTNFQNYIENIYASLLSFYRIFDRMIYNDVYLSGDTFSCRTITQLAKRIEKTPYIKLKGLIIENGFCDPANMVSISHHLYDIQVIDKYMKDTMNGKEMAIKDLIRESKYTQAFDSYDKYIKKAYYEYQTVFNNLTKYESSRNILNNKYIRNYGNYKTYLDKDQIKFYLTIDKAVRYNEDKNGLKPIRGEFMKSSMADLSYLTDKYKILMYYGQMYPEISPLSAYNFASQIKWCGKEYFKDVDYSGFFVGTNLGGYSVHVSTNECKGSLMYAMVRNAGLQVADAKPEEVAHLLKKFF